MFTSVVSARKLNPIRRIRGILKPCAELATVSRPRSEESHFLQAVGCFCRCDSRGYLDFWFHPAQCLGILSAIRDRAQSYAKNPVVRPPHRNRSQSFSL